MERGAGDGQEGDVQQNVAVNTLTASQIVDSIVAMGISRPVAEMAVRQTGGESAETAIAWVFENGGASAEGPNVEGFQHEYKMVFVVNGSLGMSPGKMAAQVGHATLGLYQFLVNKPEVYCGALVSWNDNGAKKIVVQCDSTEQLCRLETLANEENLPSYKVEDAGYTQIPAGSQTVLAVFGLVEDVDKVTGQLKLLP